MRRTLVLALANERPTTPRTVKKAIVVRRLAGGQIIEVGLDEEHGSEIADSRRRAKRQPLTTQDTTASSDPVTAA
jgi:hypothetical protein